MTSQPSVARLQEKIRELEAEVERLRQKTGMCSKMQRLVNEAEQLALLGHWELDLNNNTLYWSDEIYRIFGISKKGFGATYRAFLDLVHPDDRKFVDEAYSTSLERKTGYDIVHRLLLADGSIKYVREKCKTDYGPEGKPLRSVGTVQDITERIRSENTYAGIIGRHPRMWEVFQAIRDLAGVRMPVLISGESGTGKELVARALHSQGPRATAPFVPVNCGALPESLLESELFGHVRGAFTGAIQDKKGRFELAQGGTLFLDEISETPKPVQVKLLRVLQDGEFERVGGEQTLSVDVRIVSATNRDLAQDVQSGKFRQDLYYRIKVVPIDLPPLRERTSDIPLLVDHFAELAAFEGLRTGGISAEALAALADHDWPGNIRELQSAVHFALIRSQGKRITPAHLPPEIGSPLQSRSSPSLQAGKSAGKRKKLTSERVREAIARCDGNKVAAAKFLGVGRATLYRFLKTNPEAALAPDE